MKQQFVLTHGVCCKGGHHGIIRERGMGAVLAVTFAHNAAFERGWVGPAKPAGGGGKTGGGRRVVRLLLGLLF